ncbi:TolC family protein, partial [Oleiphilus sp. HI0086]
MFRFKTKRVLSRLMYIYSGLLVASSFLSVHASEESNGTLQTTKLVQAQSEQGGLLSLSDVLTRARANDFRLKSLGIQAKAFEAEAKASDFLPDPTLFAAIQSLPTDTFEFDQEPMTQLRVGVRQMFPKGDTLSLREDINQEKVGLQTVKQEAYWI